MEASSAFNGLPRELIWSIFDYAPDTLFDLRLASRSMKSCADEYVQISCSFQYVDEIEFSHSKAADKEILKIAMKIPKEKLSAFNLALIQKPDFADRIERSGIHYTFDYVSTEDVPIIEHLSLCMGRCIRYVNEQSVSNLGTMELISALLFGKRVTTLKINTQTLSEDIVNDILSIVRANEVEHISLYAKIVAPSNASAFLLNLSSYARSIRIHQQCVRSNGHFLWGAVNCDWIPIIRDMFSRNVETLIIDNGYSPLPSSIVNSLIEHLPRSGKIVWFEASCEPFEHEYQSFEHNEYTIETGNRYDLGIVRITHESRANGEFQDESRFEGVNQHFD